MIYIPGALGTDDALAYTEVLQATATLFRCFVEHSVHTCTHAHTQREREREREREPYTNTHTYRH